MFIISIFLFSIFEKPEIRSDRGLGKSKRSLEGISSLSKFDKRSNGPNYRYDNGDSMVVLLIILSSLWDYVLRNSVWCNKHTRGLESSWFRNAVNGPEFDVRAPAWICRFIIADRTPRIYPPPAEKAGIEAFLSLTSRPTLAAKLLWQTTSLTRGTVICTVV